MSKKIYLPVMFLMVFALVLGACAPAAQVTEEAPAVVEEAPVATEVPTEVPTEAPVVVEAPDYQAIFADIIANNGKEKGYGTINAETLNTELIENTDLYVIDVREPSELEETGYIPGAVNIPVKTLADNPAYLPQDLDTPIVVYCKSGTRSTFGWTVLNLLGYTSVRNLTGGFMAWADAGYEAEQGAATPAEISTAIIENEVLYADVKDFDNNPPESWGTVKVDDVNEMMINGEDFVLVDVRRADEFEAGYIDGAVNIPLEEIATRMDEIDPAAKIVIYCKSGTRGQIATYALLFNGYENVVNMSGGYMGWQAAGYPVVGAAPDFKTVFANVITNNGKEKAYGTMSAEALNTELIENPDLFVIDVREVSELEESGYIPGAVNIPVKTLADNLAYLPQDLDTPIVVYCKSGTRSTFGWTILNALGYTNVRNLTGGFMAWADAQYGIEEGVPAAEEISTPIVVDAQLYEAVKEFANNPPEGWSSTTNTAVNEMFVNGDEFILVDVRRADEYEAGYVDGAVNIPLEELMSRMGEIDPNAKVVVYCKSGIRSLIGTIALRFNGYADVLSMSGGYNGWVAAELPVVTP